jgi:hypothetical protein
VPACLGCCFSASPTHCVGMPLVAGGHTVGRAIPRRGGGLRGGPFGRCLSRATGCSSTRDHHAVWPLPCGCLPTSRPPWRVACNDLPLPLQPERLRRYSPGQRPGSRGPRRLTRFFSFCFQAPAGRVSHGPLGLNAEAAGFDLAHPALSMVEGAENAERGLGCGQTASAPDTETKGDRRGSAALGGAPQEEQRNGGMSRNLLARNPGGPPWFL